MTGWSAVLIAFVCGALLGALYLAGLWMSVKRATRARRPALWLLAGSAVRLTLLLAGFWLVLAGGRWQALLAALAGFLVVRTLTLNRMRRPAAAPGASPPGST